MALFDMFLKVDGILGESQDGKHKGEIEILTCDWGESQGGTFAVGGGGGAGKVRMDDWRFTMAVNKASPKLMLACATGEHLMQAVLTCRKAGREQQDFLKVTFTDLLVSRFEISSSSGGLTLTDTGSWSRPGEGKAKGNGQAPSLPLSQVGLNFAVIEYEYKQQGPDGTLGPASRVKYNLKQMKAG